jgi:galactose mutarotase-like enzyme
LDAQSLPTGGATDQQARIAVLGDTVFDDGYDQLADGAVFAVSGGGRRVEVRFEKGYPAAQVYAPIDQDVICFEPMAAPTDALRRGGYRCAMPNETAEARFSIHV